MGRPSLEGAGKTIFKSDNHSREAMLTIHDYTRENGSQMIRRLLIEEAKRILKKNPFR